jgi:hypothetical protein
VLAFSIIEKLELSDVVAASLPLKGRGVSLKAIPNAMGPT